MNIRRLKKGIKRLLNLPKGKFLWLYIANKLKHFYFKAIRSTKVAYPSSIMLELTNHCNLSCTTCPREYQFGKSMDKGTMNISNAKKIIDELWPYLDSVGLTGLGETFLHKEIYEIVNYIKEKNKGIIIFVSTNAVLPNFIEKVSRLIGKIDTIQVSIDGLDKIYEKIRIKASFNDLDTNLRILCKKTKKTGTDILLNMVVTKENYMLMPELIKYANEIGANYVDFTLFNLVSVTEIESSYYRFYQSEEFKTIIRQLEKTKKDFRNIKVTKRKFKTINNFKKCTFPWSHFYISWNGFMPPCCAKPFPKELNFGNVSNSTVIKVLNSEKYQAFRNLWYNNTPPSFCDKCHMIHAEPVK